MTKAHGSGGGSFGVSVSIDVHVLLMTCVVWATATPAKRVFCACPSEDREAVPHQNWKYEVGSARAPRMAWGRIGLVPYRSAIAGGTVCGVTHCDHLQLYGYTITVHTSKVQYIVG